MEGLRKPRHKVDWCPKEGLRKPRHKVDWCPKEGLRKPRHKVDWCPKEGLSPKFELNNIYSFLYIIYSLHSNMICHYEDCINMSDPVCYSNNIQKGMFYCTDHLFKIDDLCETGPMDDLFKIDDYSDLIDFSDPSESIESVELEVATSIKPKPYSRPVEHIVKPRCSTIEAFIAFYGLPLSMFDANKLVKSSKCMGSNRTLGSRDCLYVAVYGCVATKKRLLCERCYLNYKKDSNLSLSPDWPSQIEWALLTKLCLSPKCQQLATFGIAHYSLPIFCKHCISKYQYRGIHYVNVMAKKCTGNYPGCTVTEAIYRIKNDLDSKQFLCIICKDTKISEDPTLEYEHFNTKKCKHTLSDGSRCTTTATFNYVTVPGVAFCKKHIPVVVDKSDPMYGIPVVNPTNKRQFNKLNK